MRTSTDKVLAVGWLVSKLRPPQLSATFFVKGSFRLTSGAPAALADEALPPAGDVMFEGGPDRSLRYVSDFVPFKPRADVLLVGTAYAPGERAVSNFPVRLRVGGLQKTLTVTGNRVWRMNWLGRRPGPAQPILKLPLVYEAAWGGKKYKKNPVGRGRKTIELHSIDLDGAMVRTRRAKADPAGFGPLSASWESRKSMVGTYKGKWQKQRWPWFPEDFNWGHFNAAPRDQQNEGYLRGDEELEFQNLHPRHALYQSQLPGLRARCFLNERSAEGELIFREVPLNLDTLWIDMDAEKLVLVWRGLVAVRTLKLREIEDVFAISEPLSQAPRTLEDYRQTVPRRFAPPGPPGPDAGEAEAEAARRAAVEKKVADLEKKFAEAKEEFAKLEAAANKAFEEQKAQLVAQGVDPKLFEKPESASSAAEARIAFQSALAKLRQSNPEHAARLEGIDFSEFERMEASAARLKAELAGPPAPTRESVLASVRSGTGMVGQNLSELDLSELDLSHSNFSGASLRKTNLSKANLSGTDLSRANLSGADLTGADLTGANLQEADLSKAILVGARLAGSRITGAIFTGLDLQGRDFSGATGRAPDFSKANLREARFTSAKLPQANFSECNLEQTHFEESELRAARFGGAKARRIQMKGADLSGFQGLGKADFTEADFRNIKAPRSTWEQAVLDRANFSGALLTQANFNETSLQAASFDRASAVKASFEDARLQQARLTRANLLKASFDRADLTQADLSNSNLYEAGFWETVLRETVTDHANLRRTMLT